MTYLSVELLSKHYGLKTLFSGLTFGISKGHKTALVAPNGTGKSTLLRVIAGIDSPDSGRVMVRNGIRMTLLEQEPALNNRLTISEFISQGHSGMVAIVRAYEEAVQAQAVQYNAQTQARFEKALVDMDAANAWDYEQRMQQILGKLDIHDLDQPIHTLSGGERKRVALAFALLENPDLLLLDEPTNHLDLDMIEWLEQYLAKSMVTVLMVTHDRYFLDRVCNHIIELDAGKLYHHRGNYRYFLEKQTERFQIESVETGKAEQLLKQELEWMRRAPKARTTKSKSRIAAFYETEEKAQSKRSDSQIRLDITMTRMGSKILELSHIKKRFGTTPILNDFSYSFSSGERIGIIGRNGVGKSTFLNILTGEERPDSGKIETGTTIVFGHYRQKGIQVDEGKRVIDVIKEVAEVIERADGKHITASQFLEHFLFTPEMQYTPVAKLSGGERRRLGLMMVLIKNPNFLILDEPTNDLDLMTLNRLEDFLMDFGGCLIIVSHDRFFMDKLVQHYFIFKGDGTIKDFNGTYLEYRETTVSTEAETMPQKTATAAIDKTVSSKKGLSFHERKEYQTLEKEIEQLEQKKSELESEMGSGLLDHSTMLEKANVYASLLTEIEEKSNRWLELAELL